MSKRVILKGQDIATEEFVNEKIAELPKETLLWTNSDAGSTFSRQTINIDNLSSYDYVVIYAKSKTDSNFMVNSKSLNGYDGYLYMIDENFNLINRPYTIDWTLGDIEFDDNMLCDINSPSVTTIDNSKTIPVCVYGGKF